MNHIKIKHIFTEVYFKVSLVTTLCCYFFFAPLWSQTFLEKINDSKIKLHQTKDIPTQIDLWNSIAYEYRRIDVDSNEYYALLAIKKAEEINYIRGQAEGNKNLGLSYIKRSLPLDTIIDQLEYALDLAEQIDDQYLIAAAYGNMGLAYFTYQQVGAARISLQKGLQHLEKPVENGEYAKALLLGALAYTYFIADDLETAIEYFEECISLARKNDDRATLSAWLDTYGKILYKFGEIEKALELVKEATIYQIELGDTEMYMRNSLNLADIYMEIGDFEAAYLKSENILQFAKERNDLKFECSALYRLAQSSFMLKKIKEAEEYGDQVITILDQNSTVYQPEEMMAYLQNMYIEIGNTDKGISVAERRISWLKGNYNEKIGVEATRLEKEYFNRQIENEKKVLEKSRKTFFYWMSVLSILLIVTVASLILLYRLKQNQAIQNETLIKTNEALSFAKKEAEEASEVKNKFLSVMSHEIRTPIAAILGFTDILIEEEQKQTKLENLRYIKIAGKHLSSLIDDILDYAKMDAKSLSLDYIPFNLKELLVNLVETIRVTNQNEKVQLLLEENIPKEMINLGDSRRLKQILFNLLSNALKFTNEGYVKLEVELLEQSAYDTKLLFQVEDTGIGIATDKQDIIFDMFKQAELSTSSNYGGTGLGLTIAKELVEAHNSTLQLESELGKGSVFSFIITLPIYYGNYTMDIEKSVKFEPDSFLIGKRILLVEDNILNQKIIIKVLQNWGIECQIAQNGMEAIEALKWSSFDAILMDLNMPVMDGFEATKHIRSYNDPKSNIPIIAITANTYQETFERTREVGMNNFIVKPFDKVQIYEVLLNELGEND